MTTTGKEVPRGCLDFSLIPAQHNPDRAEVSSAAGGMDGVKAARGGGGGGKQGYLEPLCSHSSPECWEEPRLFLFTKSINCMLGQYWVALMQLSEQRPLWL